MKFLFPCSLILLCLQFFPAPSDSLREAQEASVHHFIPNTLPLFQIWLKQNPLYGIKFCPSYCCISNCPELEVMKH